ncbi:DUF58 domain-containing protein [bacterium]|nr:DUF58 domain-containing protein [bacterium]
MIPSKRLMALVALASLPFVIGIFIPEVWTIGWLINLMIILVAAVDLVITPKPRSIEIVREVSDVLSVGDTNPVTFQLQNKSRYPVTLELIDETPVPGTSDGLPIVVQLPSWKQVAAKYHFKPGRRGNSRFADLHLRYPSRLALWFRVEQRPMHSPVKIYPNIRAVSRFELMTRLNRLEELGLKMHRLRGQGSEFERLREYRIEDEPRQIDWKATARHQSLISREYNVERNQSIMLLLDCGRAMRNESDGISYMDRSLNAAIMLSYIALGQGDNVSLMAFSNTIDRYIKPLRGKPAIQTLIRSTFDLEAKTHTADYSMLVEQLMIRQRKRALVILMTHATDEQHIKTIGRYLRAYRSSHLVLCVFLRDDALEKLSCEIPEDDLAAFSTAAAAELLLAQSKEIAALKEAGIMVLEAVPEDMAAQVINQYLDIKARQLM